LSEKTGMTEPFTNHMVQAAFRYLEKGDGNGLRAVIQGYPEIVHMRERGDGQGLIHAAAKSGRADLLAVLLDFGADPNMPEGRRFDDEDRVQYVPGYMPLHHAAGAGDEDAVNLLLSRGANANGADYGDGTPLHAAQTPQIAEALLKSGADPNALCRMRYFDLELGWHFAGSPLHTAGNNVSLIRTLVGHGARVDVTDHLTGRTALHYAAARGHAPAVEVLLELGANPNAICEYAEYGGVYRYTPLHYGASNGHEDVVRELLDSGAVAQLETAYDFARKAGHHKVASILARPRCRNKYRKTVESEDGRK
jgi:ankyrin repeat protein